MFNHLFEDGVTDEQILELVFGWFNNGSGSECREFLAAGVRSLSVNDFVQVNEQWYQCLSVGWKAVTDEFVDEIEKLVVEHILFKAHGGWYALDKIMFDKRQQKV